MADLYGQKTVKVRRFQVLVGTLYDILIGTVMMVHDGNLPDCIGHHPVCLYGNSSTVKKPTPHPNIKTP